MDRYFATPVQLDKIFMEPIWANDIVNDAAPLSYHHQ